MSTLVYLTVDDGPFDDFDEKLALLNELNIKAIWYLEGEHLLEHKASVIEAIKTGHIIGNHGFKHINFSQLSLEEAKENILECDKLIDLIYDEADILRPYKTFRFPYLNMGGGQDNFFDKGDEKTAALNRFLMSLGYSRPAFIGEPANALSEANLDEAIGISVTLDTRDWSLGHQLDGERKVDEAIILEEFSKTLSSCDMNAYHIVLCHSFTPLALFKQLIQLLIIRQVVFSLPTSACDHHRRSIKRLDDHHNQKHHDIMGYDQKESIEIILLGDSITRRWEDNPEVFIKYFKPWHTRNYGVGGDMVENLIWRIENGQLDQVKPKIITLLIGTNNLGIMTDDVIVMSILHIIDLIQVRCPETTVILHGLFPRHPSPVCSNYNKRIDYINSQLEKSISSNKVVFLNLKEQLLGGENNVPLSIMPDGLHINDKGYYIWGDTLLPLLNDMMKRSNNDER